MHTIFNIKQKQIRVVLFHLFLMPAFNFLGQQIQINIHRATGDFSHFDRRFNGSTNAFLKDLEIYKRTGVKKISIYNAQSKQLHYLFELDSAANITKRGWLSHYFSTDETFYKKGSMLTVQSWYKDSTLVRVDSTLRSAVVFQNGDTIMHFARFKVTKYKLGNLLNEQNAYFNEMYLNKEVPATLPYVAYFKPGVYFKTKKKTDFIPAQLYRSSVRHFDDDFYAGNVKEGVQIQKKTLIKHPFYRTYNQQKENFFVDGEDFNEPVVYQEHWTCGSSYAYNIRPQYKWTTNDKGLNEYYFSLEYPAETSISAGKASDPGDLSSEYPPTSHAPLETLQWIVKYDYFEKY